MNELKNRFLDLYCIEGLKYNEISKELNIHRGKLSYLFDLSKNERQQISRIKSIWSRKKIKTPFAEFYRMYSNIPKKCHYCGITEDQINYLISNKKLTTKQLRYRGKKLELERINSELPYDVFNNLMFACFWCNNAKTDTFTEDEFLQIGKLISVVWTNRLKT